MSLNIKIELMIKPFIIIYFLAQFFISFSAAHASENEEMQKKKIDKIFEEGDLPSLRTLIDKYKKQNKRSLYLHTLLKAQKLGSSKAAFLYAKELYESPRKVDHATGYIYMLKHSKRGNKEALSYYKKNICPVDISDLSVNICGKDRELYQKFRSDKKFKIVEDPEINNGQPTIIEVK